MKRQVDSTPKIRHVGGASFLILGVFQLPTIPKSRHVGVLFFWWGGGVFQPPKPSETKSEKLMLLALQGLAVLLMGFGAFMA